MGRDQLWSRCILKCEYKIPKAQVINFIQTTAQSDFLLLYFKTEIVHLSLTFLGNAANN